MFGFAIGTALILALAAAGWRRWRYVKIRAAASMLPGATEDSPIRVADLGEIDAIVRSRRCICGGLLESYGERSEAHGSRMLRVVRAECLRCETEQWVYFDPATYLH